MKKLIEDAQTLAEARNQLPDSLLNGMMRKPTSWGAAPVLKLAKMSPDNKKLVNKLKSFDWSKVYDEWPRSPGGTDFDNKPPDISFVIEGEDGRWYLISSEGYKYARYVAQIIR